MNIQRHHGAALPLSALSLACLCVLYLAAGLTGHDPWKSDDAIHFGISYAMHSDGNWLLPHLPGEPFVGTPPLYYWLAALCIRLFGGWMPIHDAARLATGLFGAALLALLALAGARLHGKETAKTAVLIALGCLGLLVPMHDTQPQIALLAASALFYAGLTHLAQRPVGAGIEAGLGLGLSFLAAGINAFVLLGPVLLLVLLHPHWHSRRALLGSLLLLAVAAPLVLVWPGLMAVHEPAAYAAWRSAVGMHWPGARLTQLPDYAELLGWFTWPALPLALWSVWLLRRRLAEPPLFLPLAGSLAAILTLLLFGEPRPLLALPVLAPLILLAAAGVDRLRRGAANAFDWFAMMTFTLVAGLVWLGGLAVNLGIPTRIANNFARLQPGFGAEAGAGTWLLALGLSLGWLWLIAAAPRSAWRGLTNWAAGVTLLWTLVIVFMLPWVDYGKSYRGVAAALKKSLPAHYNCVVDRRLGAAQRFSLDYFASIRTVRAESRAAQTCDLLLEQVGEKPGPEPAGWHKMWEGHRPGDRSERLRLYRRD